MGDATYEDGAARCNLDLPGEVTELAGQLPEAAIFNPDYQQAFASILRRDTGGEKSGRIERLPLCMQPRLCIYPQTPGGRA